MRLTAKTFFHLELGKPLWKLFDEPCCSTKLGFLWQWRILEKNNFSDEKLFFHFIFQEIQVRFVDYGNVATCTIDQVRKDLIGSEIPILNLHTKLGDIDITPLFDAKVIHDQYEDNVVKVELLEPPKEAPIKVKLSLQDGLQLSDLLIAKNMAKKKSEIWNLFFIFKILTSWIVL